MGTDQVDWRAEIIAHLKDPSIKVDQKIKLKALRFNLIGSELYKRNIDDVLLKFLGPDDARLVMAKVHEGICGAHWAGLDMRWTINRYGYFWPTIFEDCIKYAQGSEECQRHSDLNHIPSMKLQSINKPWPFKGRVMDIEQRIHVRVSSH